MADDANYRDLMAHLEAVFARGDGEAQFAAPIDAPSRMMAGAGTQMGFTSGSLGMRGDRGSVTANVSGDEAGTPAGYSIGMNAGPVGYQQSRPMQRGAPAQHSFSLNLDPEEVGARLKAILNQGPGGQRSYGVGTGGEGWGAQAVYDPHRKALQISGGLERRFSHGGSVPGYAEGGLMERLRNLFKGEDYQSTGQKTVRDGEVIWGDPQSAADFFRADKARTALDKARSSVANIERASAAPRAPAVVADRAEAEPVRPAPAPDQGGFYRVTPSLNRDDSRVIPGAQPILRSDRFDPKAPLPIPYGALMRGAQGMQLPAAQPPASRGALGAIAQAAQEQQPEKPLPYSRWPMGNDRYRDVNDWTPAEVLGLMRAKRSMGETVTGYAKGGLKETDDPNQWLQFGGRDEGDIPTGVPLGQAVVKSVGVPVAEGIADAFKLGHQAYEGELPPDYFQSDEGIGRAFNAAATPMLGSFGLSHVAGPAMKSGETMLGMAVKPKGGNWIKGSIENQTKELKSGESLEDLLAANEHWKLQIEQAKEKQNPVLAGNADRYIQSNNQDIAIDNWVDKKLNKYIRNEMATPEDPIRLLAEKDILHVDPEKNLYPTWRHIPNQELLAESQAAKVWEDVSDRSLTTDPAKDYQKQNWFSKSKHGDNPWLEKLDPETPVYEVGELPSLRTSLGFNHLIDELKNAVRHDSDLPANLRLTPEKLDKVSVPQAVELVSKINKWREEAAANALAKNATNEATHLVKEYPDKGYKWVELKPPTEVSKEVLEYLNPFEKNLYQRYLEAGDTPYEALQGVVGDQAKVSPALKAALKYEGDMMGHCVGGYCEDVAQGNSRIFSLRDSKGRPHVTIETEPSRHLSGNAINEIEPGLWEKMVDQGAHMDTWGWLKENRPDVYQKITAENIVQVKGKGNAAPKEEYLPFVQDFIKSKDWNVIQDLHNTGLYKVTRGQKLPGFAKEIEPGLYSLEDFQKMGAEHEMPQDVMDQWMTALRNRPRYAKGGSVRGYAHGGLVPGYKAGGLRESIAALEGPEAQGALSPSWEGIGEGLSAVGQGLSDLYSTPQADLSAYTRAPDRAVRRDVTPAMLGAALNPEAQGASSPSLEGVGEGMRAMGEDPIALIGGALPVVGNMLAAADVSKLKDRIAELRASGDNEKADLFQRYLPLAAAGVVMPAGGGLAARGALKSAEKAAAKAAERGAGPELRASTRFPTGKSATENPLLEQLTIGPDEMRATPTFEHNMGLLSEYPGFEHLKGRSPEEQLSGYMEQARDNLNFLYENAPSVMRERSPSWYNGANNFSDALSERYGIPRQSSSAAIAALSPQMDWYKNASLAERVGDVIFGPTSSARMTPEMESFQKNSAALTSPANQAVFDSIAGKRFSDLTDPLDQALWIRLYDESHNARNYRSITPEGQLGHFITNDDGSVAKIGWGSLNEIEKAVRAYTSGGDMNIISPMLGTKHKVRSFYNNIELPDDLRFGDVTADTHAVAASQLRPLSGNTPAVAHNLASGLAKNKQPPNYVAEKSSAITGVQGTYGANAEATRMAAADQGLIPRQMQSATWEPVRELFPAKWKNAKNVEAVDNIWREKDAGNLTAEQARNAIFELAGGFREPTWAQRGPAPVDPRRGSTYR